MGIHIDMGSSVTLQQQLKDELLREIREGVFLSGQKIYTEQQIRDMTGISLVTIKAALADLVNDGVLIRRQGKGTYVKEDIVKLEQPLDKIYGFIKDYSMMGYETSSRVLKIGVVTAKDPEVCSQLQISAEDKVLKLVRVMSVNGEPIDYEVSYLPYKYFEGIEKNDFEKVALYDVMLREYGVDICRARETIEPIALSKHQAEMLKTSKGKPAFLVKRTSLDGSGRAVEFSSAVVHGEKYKYSFELVK